MEREPRSAAQVFVVVVRANVCAPTIQYLASISTVLVPGVEDHEAPRLEADDPLPLRCSLCTGRRAWEWSRSWRSGPMRSRCTSSKGRPAIGSRPHRSGDLGAPSLPTCVGTSGLNLFFASERLMPFASSGSAVGEEGVIAADGVVARSGDGAAGGPRKAHAGQSE